MTSAEYEFHRDLCNHHIMFGSYSFVSKRGRGWWVAFREQGFPSPFKTKKAASDAGHAWVRARFTEKREMDQRIDVRTAALGGGPLAHAQALRELLGIGTRRFDMETINITRTQAAKFIEKVRELGANPETTVQVLLAALEESYGVPPLKPCTGEAHSNAHIDNCSVCAPRWGLVGPKVVVR